VPRWSRFVDSLEHRAASCPETRSVTASRFDEASSSLSATVGRRVCRSTVDDRRVRRDEVAIFKALRGSCTTTTTIRESRFKGHRAARGPCQQSLPVPLPPRLAIGRDSEGIAQPFPCPLPHPTSASAARPYGASAPAPIIQLVAIQRASRSPCHSHRLPRLRVCLGSVTKDAALATRHTPHVTRSTGWDERWTVVLDVAIQRASRSPC
jgi:hypothetical protein